MGKYLSNVHLAFYQQLTLKIIIFWPNSDDDEDNDDDKSFSKRPMTYDDLKAKIVEKLSNLAANKLAEEELDRSVDQSDISGASSLASIFPDML